MAENLVEDGATLQMGIGGIPNAVLSALGNHQVSSVNYGSSCIVFFSHFFRPFRYYIASVLIFLGHILRLFDSLVLYSG